MPRIRINAGLEQTDVGGLEGGCGMFFYCYLHKGLCINVLIFSTIFGLCSLDSNGKGFRCVLLL